MLDGRVEGGTEGGTAGGTEGGTGRFTEGGTCRDGCFVGGTAFPWPSEGLGLVLRTFAAVGEPGRLNGNDGDAAH